MESFELWYEWPDGRERATFMAGGAGAASAPIPDHIGRVYAVHVPPRSPLPYAMRIEVR